MTPPSEDAALVPIAVELFEPVDLQDALVIVAFPSMGAAAPIAGTYLHSHLNLPLVGHVTSPDIAGVVHIENGIACSPLRIHGGETKCSLDGPCPRIFVLTSEVPIPAEILDEVADAIIAWAAPARMVLCLDAVARDAADDDTPDVYAGGATLGALKALESAGAETLKKGIIGGLPAFLLSQGRTTPFHVGTLIVEAAESHPDGRAAAALIETLDRMIPELVVDAKPLLEDAMQLEAQVRRAMEDAAAQQPRRNQGTFI